MQCRKSTGLNPSLSAMGQVLPVGDLCFPFSQLRGLGNTGHWTEEDFEAQRVTCWGHQLVGSAPGRSLGPSDFQQQAVSVETPRTASSRRWQLGAVGEATF